METNIQKLLVVLYKTSPAASSTIQSIVAYFSSIGACQCADCELIIWDNSPQSQTEEIQNFRLNCPIKVSFIATPENTSLSKIYNTVSSGMADSDYLTLLDQDSCLPSTYFIELRNAQRGGYPLILPQVICNGVLVSPGTRFFCKGMLLKNIKSGLIASKNLLAINSGMSATGAVFKQIHYDERLMFYGTDTYFMKQYEKRFPSAYVLEAQLNHSLAENDAATSFERKQQIAQTRRAAWKIVFSETLAERLFLFVYEFALRLRSRVRN